jgi:hypothetical protein
MLHKLLNVRLINIADAVIVFGLRTPPMRRSDLEVVL